MIAPFLSLFISFFELEKYFVREVIIEDKLGCFALSKLLHHCLMFEGKELTQVRGALIVPFW